MTLEVQLIDELSCRDGIGHVLLVVVDEESTLTELRSEEDGVEFLTGLSDTLSIRTVDDKDHTVDVVVIVAPQRTDLGLTSNVPDGEGDALVLDCLDVEADGGDGGHDLTETQLVKDRGLSSRIEADHHDLALLVGKVGEDTLEDGRDGTHCFLVGLVGLVVWWLVGLFEFWLMRKKVLFGSLMKAPLAFTD